MNAEIVIGANLGDEGKGTVVASLTKAATGPTLNVLTNGGAQRAHSILTEDGSFTFKHFGSGTYHGADTYFGPDFIVNPMQFVTELEELQSRGITCKVYMHPNCRVTTPYDMMANQIIEELRDTRHGSCGMGIWRTVKRYLDGGRLTLESLVHNSEIIKELLLTDIRDYYTKQLSDIPSHWKKVWYSQGIITHFLEDCKKMFDSVIFKTDNFTYDNIIFENGQGLMLNDTGKDIPGTTPSCTDSRAATKLFSMFGIEDATVHYVTRPYLTRHGYGYLNGESNKSFISGDIQEDRTNSYSEFQGDFRFGELDLLDLHQRILSDNHSLNRVLDVTHCDEMDRVSEMKKIFDFNIVPYDSPLIK